MGCHQFDALRSLEENVIGEQLVEFRGARRPEGASMVGIANDMEHVPRAGSRHVEMMIRTERVVWANLTQKNQLAFKALKFVKG